LILPQKGGLKHAGLSQMLVRAAWQSLRLRLGKGNAPGRIKPKRARAPHVEKSGDGGPNRQRDETPEAKPLRQQCL
jgi:hypothetical protein